MSITLKDLEPKEIDPFIYRRYEIVARMNGIKIPILPEPSKVRGAASMICPSTEKQLGGKNHRFLRTLVERAECLTCLVRKNGSLELLFASDEIVRRRAQAIAEFLAIARFKIDVWQPVEFGLIGYTSQATFDASGPVALRDVESDVRDILTA
jgi:hypothetical protein